MAFRHSWYQSTTTVFIDIFAKNTDPDTVSVQLDGSQLFVHIGSENMNFKLSQRCSSVSYKLSAIKLSIELSKSSPGEWKSLEDNGSAQPNNSKNYPTSAKSSSNWDQIDDEEQSNDVQVFLKKIYDQADEDTRRAMLKSMTESGGTVLSTNWSDVGARPVERRPPGSD